MAGSIAILGWPAGSHPVRTRNGMDAMEWPKEFFDRINWIIINLTYRGKAAI